jgi:hypothetical protein
MDKKKALLAIVRTDRTFERVPVRGVEAWQGRCIHCSAHLFIALDGVPMRLGKMNAPWGR